MLTARDADAKGLSEPVVAARSLDHTLAALADPTRRRIVRLLAERPLSAGRLGAEFTISAPALSKHLRVLRESGIVEDARAVADNRVRMYRLRVAPLDDLQSWLEELNRFWGDQLAAFQEFAGSQDSAAESPDKSDPKSPSDMDPQHK